MKNKVLAVLVLVPLIITGLSINAPTEVRQKKTDGNVNIVNDQQGSISSEPNIILTTEEQQWLSRYNGKIRIGITEIPPQVLFTNDHYKGLSIDYIQILEKKFGCNFTLVQYSTWNDIIQAAKEQRIDMIFAAQQTPDRKEYLLFSEPYIDLPNMIITNKNRQGGNDLKSMKGWTVAISDGSAVHEFLKKEFPDLILYPVTNELTGLKKVSVDEVDAMVVEISRASYYIEKEKILNLRVSGSAGLVYQLRFAVRKDWPVLREILDKGLSSITDEEKSSIDRRWIFIGKPSIFASKAFWIPFVAGLVVIVLCVVGVVIWNRSLQRIVATRTLELSKELTERKKTENELRESEEKYRTLFEESKDAIFIVDKKSGRYLDANQAGEKLTGRSLSELKNITTKDVTPQNADQRLRHLNSKKGLIDLGEVIYLRPNGTKRIAELVTVPIDHKTIYGIAKDITERKKMEETIQDAQKMESIGNLAGGIAHDFNNLLSPIIGMSELLLEDLPKESIDWENAQEIYKAGKRGSALVKQILAFSRQSEKKRVPTRIQNVLKEVLKLCRSSIPINIDIKQDIRPECGLVLANPTQVHQIAMNIITNAYHAIGSKSGKIAVKLYESSFTSFPQKTNLSPGRYVIFSVADNGHGITPETKSKIFDPYFTTKEKGKGTGLGLSVVYGIIKSHKGDIFVSSEMGKGTTFELYFPLFRKFDKTEIMPDAIPNPMGNERILLVDDEPSIAKLEKRILERLGYQITLRLNSMEALEAFRTNPDSFDLIISDVTMPSMTGDELAKEIIAIRPGIPIILCTGFSERIDRENTIALGVKGLLMKPIVSSQLSAMVRKALDEDLNS